MLRVSVIGMALALSAGAALAASAGVIRAQRGGIRAEVSFEKSEYEYHLSISIVRRGVRYAPRGGTTFFQPPKLSARDLDADGEPEVILDTYTGGAHCCDESTIFRYVRERKGYGRTYHGWGNVGYRLKDVGEDGRPELASADDRFAYVFTSFANSFFPVRLWHFNDGRLVDVTRRFPGQIRGDAAKLWRYYTKYRRTGSDVRGVLAAWMADQYLLGRQEAGWRALEAANRRGELDAADEFWPTGAGYLKALWRFLVKTGYAVP
jgi:hypothetical protein